MPLPVAGGGRKDENPGWFVTGMRAGLGLMKATSEVLWFWLPTRARGEAVAKAGAGRSDDPGGGESGLPYTDVGFELGSGSGTPP